VSKKTAAQVLEGYRHRLQDRQNWLHEKINLNKKMHRTFGYEEEEFYATRWALAFIATHPELAIKHLSEDLRERAERKES
jgi:hypothetical protein